jgi:pullulanase/glycogen debranching enzyme
MKNRHNTDLPMVTAAGPDLLTAAGAPAGYRFGPLVEADRVTFRLWAPSAKAAEVIIDGRKPVAMQRGTDGFLIAVVEGCTHGSRYKFKVGDLSFPDLASRQQDGDTSGWSIVRAPFTPSDRKTPLRPWHETVICEVHVGTVTPEGTFAALAQRLEHFRDAGYTALEIMPINEFPGRRNWGYDGTLIFAPESASSTVPMSSASASSSMSSTITSARSTTSSRVTRPNGSTLRWRRHGDRASTSTTRWCGSSITRTRRCGFPSTTSTGCASTACTR